MQPDFYHGLLSFRARRREGGEALRGARRRRRRLMFSKRDDPVIGPSGGAVMIGSLSLVLFAGAMSTTPCEGLRSLSTPQATIATAEMVPAGPFVQPGDGRGAPPAPTARGISPTGRGGGPAGRGQAPP